MISFAEKVQQESKEIQEALEEIRKKLEEDHQGFEDIKGYREKLEPESDKVYQESHKYFAQLYSTGEKTPELEKWEKNLLAEYDMVECKEGVLVRAERRLKSEVTDLERLKKIYEDWENLRVEEEEVRKETNEYLAQIKEMGGKETLQLWDWGAKLFEKWQNLEQKKEHLVHEANNLYIWFGRKETDIKTPLATQKQANQSNSLNSASGSSKDSVKKGDIGKNL